jgi:hypothetical protein
LQHLAQNEIGQGEPLSLQVPIQPQGLEILNAPQIIDPHGRVDNHHSLFWPKPGEAQLTKVTLPSNLASHRAD